MNGKTDEEIAANIAAIQRQSLLGKRGHGGVTRRTMTMATVPSAPARATTLNNHLNNNNNDDLVGHQEESLSTTADTAAIPRRSGRKRFSPQQFRNSLPLSSTNLKRGAGEVQGRMVPTLPPPLIQGAKKRKK